MADEVFLWSLSTCPWCRKAKNWLTSHEVEYGFVDVDKLPDDEYDQVVSEVRELSGSRSYPIIKIGDEIIVGFAPAKYAAALGIPE